MDQRIPVVEERVRVRKRRVPRRLRIKRRARRILQDVNVPLRSEAVEVERVPIGSPVEGPAPEVRQEGEVLVVPILEERVEVRRVLVLREEIRVRKRSRDEEHRERVPLVRHEVEIEEHDESGGTT